MSVRGRPEELFRPYYLASDVLVGLMSQRSDKGLSVMEGLSEEQFACVSRILPQLGGAGGSDTGHQQGLRREFIFNTLLLLIFRVVDFRPLVVLIDDLHFADEATLNLLRVLMNRAEVPLFVCATSTEAISGDLPLERFLGSQREELGMEQIALTPLTPGDITSHLQSVFPSIEIPEGFESQLCEIVKGNPLFLVEVLRKLVMEQKIALVGQQWVIRPMRRTELPRSLEQVIAEKVAILDEEGQQLLAQACVIGENVQLSALAGTSELMEARVFEFLDQAVRLGILNSEFEVNDESIHFISRRVLEIVYGNIQTPERQELHERAGNFQEILYERELMPSASILAYHFKCSANEQKAESYEELRRARDKGVFLADEASLYSGDEVAEYSALDEESRNQLPSIVRWMLTVVNNVRLYPAESSAIISATTELQSVLEAVLARVGVLDVRRVERGILVNGEPLEGEAELVVEGLLNILRRLELGAIVLRAGVGEHELGPLLVAFARTRPEEIDPRFWERFLVECGITNIELRQLRYTRVQTGASFAAMEGAEIARPASTTPQGEDTFESDSRNDIRELIRCLLGAARGVRLYPVRSRAIRAAHEQLEEALGRVLEAHPTLSLATAGDAVLVNGQRLGGTDVDKLTADLRDFMTSVKLAGLTFVAPVPESEVAAFIAGLRDLPELATDELFWSRFASERGLTQIHVHESLYEVREEIGVEGQKEVESDAGQEECLDAETETDPHDLASLLKSLPERAAQCLRADDPAAVAELVERVFDDFPARDADLREDTVVACRTALSLLPAGSQPIFAKLLADPLLEAYTGEDQPDPLGMMVATLRQMSTLSIEFGEYALACQLLSALYLEPESESSPSRARVLAQVLRPELDAATRDLILDDFGSPDVERQQGATRVLGALGVAAESLLVEVIRSEDSRRVRQIAAKLLAQGGDDAGAVLKRAFAFEAAREKRVRILEVLDRVTADVGAELACALADGAMEVRMAAFRLAERVATPEITEIVQEQARGPEAGPAAMAIRCLAQLEPRGVVVEVMEILRTARDPDRVIACCQALGQLNDPVAIAALAKVLAPRRPFSLRRGWESGVRKAGALALSQLGGEEAASVLARYVDDAEPAVRRIARNAGRPFERRVARRADSLAGVKLGVCLVGAKPALYSQAAREAEALGFESVWFPEAPAGDAFAHLSAAAGATGTLRLGVQVVELAHRDPLALARGLQALDDVSQGRAELIVGEPGSPERAPEGTSPAGRLSEAIILCKRLWTEDVVQHNGESFHVADARLEVKPLQKPWPPLLVAGATDAAIWRAARMGDGWVATAGALEALPARIELLRRYQRENETADGRFELSVSGENTLLRERARLHELGVDRLIVSTRTPESVGLDSLRELARLAAL